MTKRVKAFLLHTVEIDRSLEIAIAVLFLAAMAYAGWTTAGMV